MLEDTAAVAGGQSSPGTKRGPAQQDKVAQLLLEDGPH